MEHSLSNVFHGRGLVYTAESSDAGVMTAAVTPGGKLVLDPVGAGTAVITVTAAGASLSVDGTVRDDGLIPLVDDGREHEVSVTLPES